MRFGDLIASRASCLCDKTAVIYNDKEYSYAEIDANANSVAAFLRANGIGVGNHVVYIAYNSEMYFEILTACSRIGAVFTPISWRMCAESIIELVDATDAKAFTKLGGEIMLNAPVEKAVVKDGKVVGVIVNGEEIDCDMMVYNGDIKTAVNKVIGAEHFDKEYVDYVNALKYSWGGTTVKLAVDGHLTDLKMLSQFGTLDQEKFYEDLAKGIIPEEVNFFMSNPSNYSKSAAPEGKQMICFTCPHQLDLPEEIEARLVDKMMVTAEKYIPGLSEHIIIKEVLFNSDIMTASGKGGAGIGIGQVAGQTGAYRPKIKLPVEGAYVVGAAAGGAGVGTELAVNSAIEFFDNYCK